MNLFIIGSDYECWWISLNDKINNKLCRRVRSDMSCEIDSVPGIYQ